MTEEQEFKENPNLDIGIKCNKCNTELRKNNNIMIYEEEKEKKYLCRDCFDTEQEKKEYEEYEKNQEQIDKIFPNANFHIDIHLSILDDIFTTKKQIFITHSHNCYCYTGNYRPTEFFEIKGDKITYRYIFNELIRQGLNVECNHCFFEGFDKTTNIQYSICFGS